MLDEVVLVAGMLLAGMLCTMFTKKVKGKFAPDVLKKYRFWLVEAGLFILAFVMSISFVIAAVINGKRSELLLPALQLVAALFASFNVVFLLSLPFRKVEQKMIDKMIEQNKNEKTEGKECAVTIGQEIARAKGDKNSVILSSTTVLQDTNQNILVVGIAGSGKTLTYVLPNLFQTNGSYVIVDMLGVLFEDTVTMFEEKGYRIKTFDVAKTTTTDIELFDAASIGCTPTAVYIRTTFDPRVNATVVPPLIQKIMTECTSPTEIPVHLLLDEFCNISKIPDFCQLLATSGPTVSCSIIIQNIQQLCRLYPETWKDIVLLCDATVYLGSTEANTLQFIKEKANLTPDEIAHMSDQDCLVMIKGQLSQIDKKYDPFKTLLYQKK